MFPQTEYDLGTKEEIQLPLGLMGGLTLLSLCCPSQSDVMPNYIAN